jgi:HD-GYP domain-containing protein (c-di-GMP phosphodiesterase class II)
MLAFRNATARDRRPFAADRVQTFAQALQDEFSASFSFYDGSTGELLSDRVAGESPVAARDEVPPEVLAIAAGGRPRVSLKGAECFRLVLPIQEPDGSTLVAIGEIRALARSSQAVRLEQARLQKWLQAVQSRLSFTACATIPQRSDQAHVQQLKILLEASRDLTDLLAGFGSLGESSNEPSRILRRAAAVVCAETVIWVPSQEDEPVVIEGDRRLSAREGHELARWLATRPERDASGYLIFNEAPTSGLGNRFPGILNLMGLSGDDRNSGGWLIVLNKLQAAPDRSSGRDGHSTGVEPMAVPLDHAGSDRPAIAPFRGIDVALMKPFASLLGLQSRSARRQSQVQDLFAGLVRSLTAAIDAKDPYTCGHSERVARVAVELAREMGLPEAELGDVYLAGLLHDIGKIGVPDSVLGKRGPLTTDEFARITEHVLIGYRILEGFHGISHLLPSVLAHHERFDGTGYPHGLKGESIPLLARILAVADCFDAMNTARPYRSPLPRDQIEATLTQGRGRQWDADVIDAFFRARDRIYAIQPRGVGDSVWFALHGPERGPHPHFPVR